MFSSFGKHTFYTFVVWLMSVLGSIFKIKHNYDESNLMNEANTMQI